MVGFKLGIRLDCLSLLAFQSGVGTANEAWPTKLTRRRDA